MSDEVKDWQVKAIEEGVTDAEAGNLTALDDVKKKWRKRHADGGLIDMNPCSATGLDLEIIADLSGMKRNHENE